MSSPVAVSSRRVLPARLEPGPWILRGAVVLSGAAIMVGPVARPEAMYGTCEAHVRGVGFLRVVNLLEAGTPEVDVAPWSNRRRFRRCPEIGIHGASRLGSAFHLLPLQEPGEEIFFTGFLGDILHRILPLKTILETLRWT
jgi:hypothetical protein